MYMYIYIYTYIRIYTYIYIIRYLVIVAIWGVLSAFELETAPPPYPPGRIRGAFESFESDLSSAHAHFWIWGHLDRSNFGNEVFSPPARCHVLVSRATRPPYHHPKKRSFDASAPGDLADFFWPETRRQLLRTLRPSALLVPQKTP